MDHVIQLNSYDDCQKKKTNAMSIITGSNNSRRDREGGSEDCAKSNISSVSGGDSNNSVAESSISIDGLSSSGRRRASRGDFRLSDSTRTAGDTARGESAATTSSLMYRHESPQHEQLSEETSSQRSSFRRKSEIVLEELTINKLRLADVGFYGRESEQKILKEALERCHSSTKEVVWIYGYSGSGKTTLARSIMKQRQQPQKGKQQDVVFVESKFDMLSSLSEPLSGILSICSQLCQEVIERLDGTSNSEKVRMELEDQLGKEQVYMLTNILPELQYFALEKDHQREEAVSESAPNTISTSRHKTMDERTDVVAGCPANHDNDSPDKDTDDWTMGTSHSTSTEAQTQQLKYCLRVLLRVMMSHIQQRTAGNGNTDIDYDSFGSTVVVLLLDDLQWGSSEELQILKDFLLNDNEEEEGGGGGKGNKAKPSVGLLILGCYRSNEVHHEEIIRGKSQQEEEHQHPMCQLIDDLNYHSLNVHQSTTKNGKNNHVLKLTSVEVGNLKIVDCNQIIMDLLSIDDCERTIKLATLCHQRTLGNAYFLTQFVVMLYDYGLLEYNLGLLQWNWNLSQIEQKTSASPNVVTLVKERMQNTSNEPLRHFLKVLSCLGPLPSYRVIAIAWSTKVQQQEPAPSSHEDKVVTNNTKTMATTAEVTVDMLIEDAMESNYIERSGGSNTNHFRFVHDKILEASLAIMTEEEKRILRYRIGIQLWNELTEKEIESEIFLITDLINSCPLYSDPDNHGLYNAEQRLDHDLFIDLNLRSAEKAKELSSFSSSLKYAMEGISVLSQQATCWQNKYDTSLRLYSVGAETSGSIGQVDLLDDICQVALHRNDVPIFDKLRIYNALLDSMASNGKLVEAQTLVCDLLNQLGCRVPRPGMTQALRTLWSISTLNRNPPSKEAIQVLPKMINRNQSECLRLLYQLQTFSYLNREVPLFLWSCTRQVQLTMKYGVHELSAAAFPAMGAIMVALFSDFQTGALFAQNGRLIVDLWGHKVSEARVAFGCVIAPAYYQPMQSLVKGLSASAKIGMQVGDTDSAMWCLAHSCWLKFMTGKPLQEVEADCRVGVNRMKLLNRKEAMHFTCPLWQTTLNLVGFDPFRTALAGEAFEIEDENDVWEIAEAGPLRPHLEICKTALKTYFGDYVSGADLFINRGDRYLNDHPGHPQGNMDSFLKGVCLFAASQQSKKSKYRKHAYKARAVIASWWKKGNPNSQHQLSFLDAEHFALNKKWEDALICYQKTIALASRYGLIQDAALANERYSVCLTRRNKHGDAEEAAFRLQQSMELFREWGALAVVESLQERYGATTLIHRNRED